LYKSIPPAIFSTIIYIILWHTTEWGYDKDNGTSIYNSNTNNDDDNNNNDTSQRIFRNSDGMAVLVTVLMFLLQFRANFAYGRYWDAMSAVHVFHGKLVDCGSEIAAFHLQCNQYNQYKPPSYGSTYPELTTIISSRNCNSNNSNNPKDNTNVQKESRIRSASTLNKQSVQTASGQENKAVSEKDPIPKQQQQFQAATEFYQEKDHQNVQPPNAPLSNSCQSTQPPGLAKNDVIKSSNQSLGERNVLYNTRTVENNKQVEQQNNKSRQYQTSTFSDRKTIAKDIVDNNDEKNDDDPIQGSLFLQEAAHLLSLLSAVALSTLRNDIEGTAQLTLIEFIPNQPFPHIDPDSYSADVSDEWVLMQSKYCSGLSVLSYMFGLDRTKKHRLLYNAARSFRVIGNISDNEIRMLQLARCPTAKVSLIIMWLNEFLIRESLNNSFGTMDAPIISRLWQLTSDAMVGYNTARMISYNPFPFPSAQLTSFFVFTVLILLPSVMLSYTRVTIVGLLFNFLTVMCFTGLHEVARELEEPFRNTPNDIPLNNFQGQYNESLMTMFYGYHPDSNRELYKQQNEVIIKG
jgi:predicted membrane chloride channel (bestrophin family)